MRKTNWDRNGWKEKPEIGFFYDGKPTPWYLWHLPKIVGVLLLIFIVILALMACERRELYVYGDEFHSVDLEVNWRKYADKDPDGMTVWFYPLGNELGKPYRTTTANVRKQSLYLPGGLYNGVVIDYSPEEYSRQRFLGLDSLKTARTVATPASYQPDSLTVAGEAVRQSMNDSVNQWLYGEGAWTDKHTGRSEILDGSGLYMVASQPEQMALDTLSRVVISHGGYGDYVPWKEADTYQSTIQVQTLFSEPSTIVWHLRVRVYIASGFNSLWQTPGSISGLADGHFLATDTNTDTPCLISIDNWELERVGENSGYISATITTFGLRPGSLFKGDRSRLRINSVATRHSSSQLGSAPAAPASLVSGFRIQDAGDATGTDGEGVTRADNNPANQPGWYDYETDLCDNDELRLNLVFVLRDHSTAIYYQFDVGEQVASFDEQLVLRLDLGPDYFNPAINPNAPAPIELPYVEAYSGAGFDANVTDWSEGGTADTTF